MGANCGEFIRFLILMRCPSKSLFLPHLVSPPKSFPFQPVPLPRNPSTTSLHNLPLPLRYDANGGRDKSLSILHGKSGGAARSPGQVFRGCYQTPSTPIERGSSTGTLHSHLFVTIGMDSHPICTVRFLHWAPRAFLRLDLFAMSLYHTSRHHIKRCRLV
jgi:hypothetical protein